MSCCEQAFGCLAMSVAAPIVMPNISLFATMAVQDFADAEDCKINEIARRVVGELGYAALAVISLVEAAVRAAFTALAAILAMITLTRSVFWGPMAITMMGGLLVATVLTLLFVPALYAAWFRVRRPAPEAPILLPQPLEASISPQAIAPV